MLYQILHYRRILHLARHASAWLGSTTRECLLMTRSAARDWYQRGMGMQMISVPTFQIGHDRDLKTPSEFAFGVDRLI